MTSESDTRNYKILRLLGEGSYGKVYLATDENGKEHAIKQISLDSNGVPCLLEAAIMSTFDYQGINSASQVFITNDYLNIVQDRAQGDLSKIIRKQPPPLEQVRRWLARISKSVYCLHRLGIIHADLKAGNILYFGGDDVRLADFTLSTKLWSTSDKFRYPACTYSHCPPEALMGQEWNRSLDIWSLGCCFYEVAFGCSLFPNQGRHEEKKELRKRYCRAIYNYLEKHPYEENSYTPVEVSPKFFLPEYALLRSLIEAMLKIQPDQRISIEEVLEHPFFDEASQPICDLKFPLVIKNVFYTPLPSETLEKLETGIQKLLKPCMSNFSVTSINNIRQLTLAIYQRCTPLLEKKTLNVINPISLGSLWLASKLVVGLPIPVSTSYKTEQIHLAEKRICVYLNFCFPILTHANFF